MSFLDEEAFKIDGVPPFSASYKSYFIATQSSNSKQLRTYFLHNVTHLQNHILYLASIIIEFPGYSHCDDFIKKNRHSSIEYQDQDLLIKDLMLDRNS